MNNKMEFNYDFNEPPLVPPVKNKLEGDLALSLL